MARTPPRTPPRTTLAAALALCGLTPASAAYWLDVEERLVRDWIAGRAPVPQGVFRMLAVLYGRMTDAALVAATVAEPRIALDPWIPDRAQVNDVDDPYPGHGEVMAGAMAVLIALGHDEQKRAARSGGGIAGLAGGEGGVAGPLGASDGEPDAGRHEPRA